AGLDYVESDGTVTYPGRFVMVVSVDPIWAQAGVVDVRAGVLQGGGSFIAPNDARIDVLNHTPAFLEIKGASIPLVNGGLYLNGDSMRDNATINARSHGSGANFDLSQVQFGASTAPAINIINDLNVKDTNSFTPAERYQDPSGYPWPDIT